MKIETNKNYIEFAFGPRSPISGVHYYYIGVDTDISPKDRFVGYDETWYDGAIKMFGCGLFNLTWNFNRKDVLTCFTEN